MLSDNKTRIFVNATKEMKKELEHIAKIESRSLSNLVIKILQDYLKSYNQ